MSNFLFIASLVIPCSLFLGYLVGFSVDLLIATIILMILCTLVSKVGSKIHDETVKYYEGWGPLLDSLAGRKRDIAGEYITKMMFFCIGITSVVAVLTLLFV